MKYFIVMLGVFFATVAARAGEITDCSKLADGNKTVDCAQLSGAERIKCEARKAPAGEQGRPVR